MIHLLFIAANITAEYTVAPKQRLLVRLDPTATRDQREDILDGLRYVLIHGLLSDT